MSTKIMRYPIGNLGQGIIADQNPLEIPPGACVVGTNNVVQVDGFLRARSGLLSVYQLPVVERVHHLSVHQTLAGVNNLVAVTLNSTSGDATFWYFVSSAWTNIGTIPSPYVLATIPSTSCNFNYTTYLAPGNGPLYQFDDATLTLQTVDTVQTDPNFQPPDLIKLIVAGDPRLIAANFSEAGSSIPFGVDWSDFEIPTTWQGPIANQGGDSGGTALPKNSDPITGMYVDSSVLTIFRAREVYLGVEVGSPGVYTVRCFVQGPGCVSHATIQPYRDGAIVWLGDDNVYIGAPGQQPQPIGDHIRLRLRQICNLSLLPQSVGQLDYDHQLYTLYLPDATTGFNTRLLTVNLRTGGWWEGQIADPSMKVTCGCAFRTGPWETQNLVGTDDGRILQSILGYTQDDQTPFPCAWVSGILPSRSFFGYQHEQACVQTLRVIGLLANSSPTETAGFTLKSGDGIDHFRSTGFSPLQTLDGVSALFSYDRVTNENFQVMASSTSGAAWPNVCQIEIGAIPQGMTR